MLICLKGVHLHVCTQHGTIYNKAKKRSRKKILKILTFLAYISSKNIDKTAVHFFIKILNNSDLIIPLWKAITKTYLTQYKNKKGFVFPIPFCHRYIFNFSSNTLHHTHISLKTFSFYFKENFNDRLVNQCSANTEFLISMELWFPDNSWVSRNHKLAHCRFWN